MTNRPAIITDEFDLVEGPFCGRLDLNPCFAGVLRTDDTAVISNDDKTIACRVRHVEKLVRTGDELIDKC